MDWNRKNNREILREVAIPTAEGGSFPLLKFPILEETGLVEHCFTTRYGGVSEGEFSSLNLSYTRGDDKAAVDENFRRLANAIGVTVNDFVFSDQTHTTNVLRVGKEDRGSGIVRPRPYHDVDGLITNEPQVVLSTFFADCVPLYFVDVKKKAIGMSHSGWRGTVGRMGAKTLEAMTREFGTDPADVVAAVGPSICRDCYEISDDVAKVFMDTFPAQHRTFLEEKGGGKYQLDLWKCNELILLEAGIRPEHLAVTNICTCCNPTHLFSHRASKGRRGNLGAFLYLKKEN
jgi:hypothetical protein